MAGSFLPDEKLDLLIARIENLELPGQAVAQPLEGGSQLRGQRRLGSVCFNGVVPEYACRDQQVW